MDIKQVMKDVHKVTNVFDITLGKILWDITLTMHTLVLRKRYDA